MTHVCLIREIIAEGVKVPVGTICEVERAYDHSLDLRTVIDGVEVLFWVRLADVVEAVK